MQLAFHQLHKELDQAGLIVSEHNLASLDRDYDLNVVVDSREVDAHSAFLAYSGVHTDGHQFIHAALANQAALVICENVEAVPKGTPAVVVTNARRAWAFAASCAFDHPEKSLSFFGVTGTNGKTSTVWLARQMLDQAHHPCISIGTLGCWIGDQFYETQHTTPDPPALYKFLREAVDSGIRFCVMEVASNALTQQKLAPIKFGACGFTSFSRDHLDLHGTMAAYFAAKLSFFQQYAGPDPRFIVNREIERRDQIPTCSDTVVYGSEKKVHGGEASIAIERMTTEGMDATVQLGQRSERFHLPLIGQHNAENFLCAFLGVEKLLNKALSTDSIGRLEPIPGRLEPVRYGKQQSGPLVVVDYSHTPDAIEKALQQLRPLTTGHLWIVFGCGGDRDKGKRPLMAASAEQFADRVVVTSDNPRHEDPSAIIRNIVAGLTDDSHHVEEDRAKAIAYAVNNARGGDTVLIAGKGHETYMVVGDSVIEFDDRLVAKKALVERTGHES